MKTKKIQNILVTGAAGFIGFHLSKKLLDNGIQVTGLDNLNNYYDPNLKQARLDLLTPNPPFTNINIDLADRSALHCPNNGGHLIFNEDKLISL